MRYSSFGEALRIATDAAATHRKTVVIWSKFESYEVTFATQAPTFTSDCQRIATVYP